MNETIDVNLNQKTESKDSYVSSDSKPHFEMRIRQCLNCYFFESVHNWCNARHVPTEMENECMYGYKDMYRV